MHAQFIGGREKWYENVRTSLDLAGLAEVVSLEKQKFKLANINDYGIQFRDPV